MPVGDLLFTRLEECSIDELVNVGRSLGSKDVTELGQAELVYRLSEDLRYHSSHTVGHWIRKDPHALEYRSILHDVATKMSSWKKWWNTKIKDKAELDLEEYIWEIHNENIREQMSKLSKDEREKLKKEIREGLKSRGYSEAAITSLTGALLGGGAAAAVAPAIAYSIAASSATGLSAIWIALGGTATVSGTLMAGTVASIMGAVAVPIALYWAGTPAMRKVIPAVLALITYHKQRQFLESPDKFDPMLVDLFDGEPFTVEGVLREGDHIRVSRKVGSYGHHGLYIGDEKIIHFDGEPTNVSKASIRVDSLSYFADRGTVSSVQYPPRLCFSTKRTIERAMFRLDHKGFKVDSKTYNLFSNNCEHFASWAKTGLGTSLQVDALKESLLLGAVSGLLRVGYVLFAGGSLVSPVGLIAVVGPALVNYFRSSDKISVPPPISLVLKEEQVKLMVLELLLTQKEINSQEITLLLEELSHLEHYSLGLYVDSELLGQSKLIRKELCESIGEKQADKYNVLEDLSGFVRVHYEKKRVLLEALQRKLSSSMDASGMKQDVYDYVGLLKEDVRLFENPANFYTSLKFG